MNLKSVLQRLFITLMLLFAINSIAQQAINTPPTAENGTILEQKVETDAAWLVLGGISRHSCRDCGFRESNPGLALQWHSPWFEELTGLKNTRLTAGSYINSNDKYSVYGGAQWMPYSYGTVKLGLQAVLITGYLEAKITPVVLPLVSIETQHVGLDVYAVPKLSKVSAAVFATLKVRF
jgi:hypothetical protein